MKPYNTNDQVQQKIFANLYCNYINELGQYSERVRNNPVTPLEIEDINTNPLLHRYFITDERQNPIGFCLIGFGKNTQPGTHWYIAEFYVQAESRKKGYGTRAIEELFNGYLYRGKYCYFVLKENHAAYSFWENIKRKFNCKDITSEYDAQEYTPKDCIFYAFEYCG